MKFNIYETQLQGTIKKKIDMNYVIFSGKVP